MGDFPLLNFNKPNFITTFAYMYDKIYFLLLLSGKPFPHIKVKG